MITIPLSLSKKRERSRYVPLYNPHPRKRSTSISIPSISPIKKRKRSTNALHHSHEGKSNHIPSLPFRTHGMGIAMPLFLSLTQATGPTRTLSVSHTQEKGLRTASIPTIHKEKVYPCALSLPHTRKKLKQHPISFFLLPPNHTHGKRPAAITFYPFLIQGNVIECPCLPSIPNTRKRSNHASLALQYTGKRFPVTMPSIPTIHKEMV